MYLIWLCFQTPCDHLKVIRSSDPMVWCDWQEQVKSILGKLLCPLVMENQFFESADGTLTLLWGQTTTKAPSASPEQSSVEVYCRVFLSRYREVEPAQCAISALGWYKWSTSRAIALFILVWMMTERNLMLQRVLLILLGLTLETAYTHAFTPSRIQQHKILHLGEL